ncbi:hypothetical protein XBJ1_1390 [Xenorhabdus bovienii SS-2004]|uniref:Uncharacterized protein n=1 Tax=Xenorhabdus bovienii (strain SS-2004) TaxID=406818 RepID=D3V0E9_XENBS|nr:hypothetical protein XBJ1_1390 [Xenorhabdus bovienii SS-2004]
MNIDACCKYILNSTGARNYFLPPCYIIHYNLSSIEEYQYPVGFNLATSYHLPRRFE